MKEKAAKNMKLKERQIESQPRKRPFRVHASLEILVCAEVTVYANAPDEATNIALSLLGTEMFNGQLNHLIDGHTIRVPGACEWQSDIRVEALLLDLPCEPLVWRIADLSSGESYQAIFKASGISPRAANS